MKCERTGCWQPATWVLEMHHAQGDGTSDRQRRDICDTHAKEELPQNLSPLADWAEFTVPVTDIASESDA